MNSVDVKLNHGGMKDLLNSAKVEAFLAAKAARVLAAAKASAPVASGAYRNSLHVVVAHTDRVVLRVTGGTDHDLVVEANTGNLARALDAGR